MDVIEIFKVIILGIVEGITEWLPVSSTGHMYLMDEFWPLALRDNFKELFFVVIQFGAILAVIVTFWNNLCPIGIKKGLTLKKDVCALWLKVAVACIPTAVLGFLLDDFLEKYLYNGVVIALMLVGYGVAFILVENWNKHRLPRIRSVSEIDYKTAIAFGLFQSLAMIPGTSRSGATIVGALLIGVSRSTAAEFTFFLAIPTMFGASLLKLVKFFLAGNSLFGGEVTALFIGMAVAFAVSLLAIHFLMNFVKKHNFKIFGWYRIALGVAVLILFWLY